MANKEKAMIQYGQRLFSLGRKITFPCIIGRRNFCEGRLSKPQDKLVFHKVVHVKILSVLFIGKYSVPEFIIKGHRIAFPQSRPTCSDHSEDLSCTLF